MMAGDRAPLSPLKLGEGGEDIGDLALSFGDERSEKQWVGLHCGLFVWSDVG